MNYKIRRLRVEEIEQAKYLFRWFQEDDGIQNPAIPSDSHLNKLLARDDFHALAAFDKETLIGGLTAYELAGYKNEKPEMFLFELGVSENYRRKGVAAALIDALKELCREKEIDEMFVGALADNFAAVKLYEHTGGKAASVIEFTYKLA